MIATWQQTPLADGDLLAAVDIGSNSFHMVVARIVLGQLRIVDRIKENVRLAEGLDENGGLSEDALLRAHDCLQRFGQRLAELPRSHVRAVATNTVRRLRQPHNFLIPAEAALGHEIEIISGREEARLVYLGVAHGTPPHERLRLVVDIGGGSTEFIIGAGFNAIERESLQMGCIATTRRFFADGGLSVQRWQDARTAITAEFQQFSAAYRRRGWEECFGSSGTIRAIADVATAMKLTRGDITASALQEVRDRVLRFERIDDVKLPGLPVDRRPVFAGGLLILDAVFTMLELDSMLASDFALREGVLYDFLGRGSERDLRDASIQALGERYDVDVHQARRVELTALSLFDQVAGDWGLDLDDRRLLAWAARIHEIGLAIAHSKYHKHGGYLVEHSDVAGFSRTEQQFIAALIRNQRRSLHMASVEQLSGRLPRHALRSALLLRLSVLLHRSHDRAELPDFGLEVSDSTLRLQVPRAWLAAHPLTEADLANEGEHLRKRDYSLVVVAVDD